MKPTGSSQVGPNRFMLAQNNTSQPFLYCKTKKVKQKIFLQKSLWYSPFWNGGFLVYDFLEALTWIAGYWMVLWIILSTYPFQCQCTTTLKMSLNSVEEQVSYSREKVINMVIKNSRQGNSCQKLCTEKKHKHTFALRAKCRVGAGAGACLRPPWPSFRCVPGGCPRGQRTGEELLVLGDLATSTPHPNKGMRSRACPPDPCAACRTRGRTWRRRSGQRTESEWRVPSTE